VTDGPLSTGIAGLDQLLRGGLVRNRLYLIEGKPGTGKTTIAMQFLLEGIVTTFAGGVIGIDGLTVCDASLMPTIPCANLNVPVIMTAEKISAAMASTGG
jgi:Ni2+-binding GTPase involved in maturation of urease and hydrogenase